MNKAVSRIRPDRVSSKDLNEYNLAYACEDCVHYESKTKECLIGLKSQIHLKSNQLKQARLSGEMLFCRFIDIE